MGQVRVIDAGGILRTLRSGGGAIRVYDTSGSGTLRTVKRVRVYGTPLGQPLGYYTIGIFAAPSLAPSGISISWTPSSGAVGTALTVTWPTVPPGSNTNFGNDRDWIASQWEVTFLRKAAGSGFPYPQPYDSKINFNMGSETVVSNLKYFVGDDAQIQVRQANAVGSGPWYTSAIFTIN